MMKTRFLMLAMMMCMSALTFSACSDDDDDDKSINVPEAVTQALKQKYPNATDVDWKQKIRAFLLPVYVRRLEAEKLVFCGRLLAGRKRFRYMV